MRKSLGSLAISLTLMGALTAPSMVSAQSMVVLGVRSVEGDDEFTRNLTGALRHAASQIDGWNVTEREVTLAQMALAHGCDEPDTSCMAEIADSLEAQLVIYGDVRRTSSGDNFDWSVNLHIFNGVNDQLENSVTDTIPGVRRDIDDLRDHVRRYVAALSGAARVGTISITSNVPAEVFLDGESVGMTNEGGQITIPDIPAGTRRVRLEAEGYGTFNGSVAVEAWGDASLEATLTAGGGSGGGFPVETVVGVSLLIVAAGLVAGWVGSWAQVTFGIGESANWARHRADFTTATENICADGLVSSRQMDRIDTCRNANTLEILQFVFGVGAAVAGGVGLYLLITGLSGDDDDEEGSVRLLPSVGPTHGYLGLEATF